MSYNAFTMNASCQTGGKINNTIDSDDYTKEFQTSNFVVFAIYNIVVVVSLALMVMASYKNIYLKKRGEVLMISLSSLGGILVSFLVLRLAVGIDNYPCLALLILGSLMIPLVIGPVIARTILFYNRTHYSRTLHNISLESLEEAQFEATLMAHLESLKEAMMFGNESDKDHGILATAARSIGSYSRKHASRASRYQRIASFAPNGSINLQALSDMGNSTGTQHAVSIVSVVFILPSIIYCVFRIAFTPVYSNNCYGCVENIVDVVAGGVQILYTLAIGVWALYRVHDAPDPLGTLHELRLCFIIAFIVPIVGFILFLVYIPAINDVTSFSFTYVYLAACFLLHFVQVILPLSKLQIFTNLMTKLFPEGRLRLILSKEKEAPNIRASLYDFEIPDFGYWNLSVGIQNRGGSVLGVISVSQDNANNGNNNNITSNNDKSKNDDSGSERYSDLSTQSITLALPNPGHSRTASDKAESETSSLNHDHARLEDASSFRSASGLGVNTGTSVKPKSRRHLFATMKEDGMSTSQKKISCHHFGAFGPNGEYLDSALSVLMHDPTGRLVFEEYVTQEFSPEGPRFLAAVEQFRLEYDISSPKMRYKTGLRIYSLFIFEGSFLQVNIRSEHREALDKVFSGGYGPSFQFASPSQQLRVRRMSVGSGVLRLSQSQEHKKRMQAKELVRAAKRAAAEGRPSQVKSNNPDAASTSGTPEKIAEDKEFVSSDKDGVPEIYKQVLEDVKAKQKKRGDYFVELPIDVFDTAADEIFLLLCNDSYIRFRESEVYRKWLLQEPANARRFPRGAGNRLIVAPSPSSYVNSMTGNTRPMTKRLQHAVSKGVQRLSVTAKDITEIGARKRESVFGVISGVAAAAAELGETISGNFSDLVNEGSFRIRSTNAKTVRFEGDNLNNSGASQTAGTSNTLDNDENTFMMEMPEIVTEEDN